MAIVILKLYQSIIPLCQNESYSISTLPLTTVSFIHLSWHGRRSGAPLIPLTLLNMLAFPNWTQELSGMPVCSNSNLRPVTYVSFTILFFP